MQQGTSDLPSVLIVVNANFVPRGPNGPFPYGGAYFVAELARELTALGSFSGFLLYQRDESLREPHLEEDTLWGWPAYRLHFNFGHSPRAIAHLVRRILQQASAPLRPSAVKRQVVLYHQTGVLLPFVGDVSGIVTHHGPFVRDVVDVSGHQIAVEAYGGGVAKLEALAKLQQSGLRTLIRSANVRALEISPVQSQSLIDNGLSQNRLATAPPLIRVPEDSQLPPPAEVRKFIDQDPGHLIVVSAVARLDAFKNIELLVDAVVHLRAADQPIRCLIIGGPLKDDAGRLRLLERIPCTLRASFLLSPRLTRDNLHSTFRAIKDQGLFVCTSRFETLGITGLEAMCCGLPLAVTDLPRWVGLANYVPALQRFRPTVPSLSDFLASVMADPTVLTTAKSAAAGTRTQLNRRGFREALVRNMEFLAA